MGEKITDFFQNFEASLLNNKTTICILGFLLLFILLLVTRALDRKNSRTMDARRVKEGRYQTPYEYEDYVAYQLMQEGYENVRTTRGSRDYGADILCEKDRDTYAVQVKMYSGSVGYRAVEEALAGMHYYNCSRAMVITTGRFTKQAIEAAERMGIILLPYYT